MVHNQRCNALNITSDGKYRDNQGINLSTKRSLQSRPESGILRSKRDGPQRCGLAASPIKTPPYACHGGGARALLFASEGDG